MRRLLLILLLVCSIVLHASSRVEAVPATFTLLTLPTSLPAGSSFYLSVSPSAVVTAQLTLTLDVGTGYNFSSTVFAWKITSNQMMRKILIPQQASTVTLRWASNDETVATPPPPTCIEVLQTRTAVAGTGAQQPFSPASSSTNFIHHTRHQLHLSADFYLSMSSPFNPSKLAEYGCYVNLGPSGIRTHMIFECDGSSPFGFLTLSNPVHTLWTRYAGFGIVSKDMSFTMSTWIKPHDVQSVNRQAILVAGGQLPDSTLMFVIELQSGILSFTARQNATVICSTSSSSFFLTINWYHIALTFGNGGCTLAVNGARTVTVPNAFGSAILPSWQPTPSVLTQQYAFLGGYNDSVTLGFAGSFSTFALWNDIVLEPREIAFLAADRPGTLAIPSIPQRTIARNLATVQQPLWSLDFSRAVSSPTHGTSVSAVSGVGGFRSISLDGLTQTFSMLNSGDTTPSSVFPTVQQLGTISTSFAMWLAIGNLKTNATVFEISESGTDNTKNSILLTIDSTSLTHPTLRFTLKNAASQVVCTTDSFLIPMLVEHSMVHVVTVYDQTLKSCSFWVNAQRFGYGVQAAVAPSSWTVGNAVISPSANRMNAILAEIKYYNTALLSSDVAQLYLSPPLSVAAPSPITPSIADTILGSSDYDWLPTQSYTSSVSVVQVDVSQPDDLGVLSYDGVSAGSSYTTLSAADQSGTGMTYDFPQLLSPAVSIAMWFLVPSNITQNNGCLFSTKANPGSNEYSMRITASDSFSGELNFLITQNGVETCFVTPDAGSDQRLMKDKWHHVVVTVEGDTCRMYRNGVLVAQGYNPIGPAWVIPTGPFTTLVGACEAAVPDQRFTGLIAQLTAWQRTLSEAEVAVLVTQPPPSISRLIDSTLPSSRSALTPRPTVEWTFSQNGLNYAIANNRTRITSTSYIDLLESKDNQPLGRKMSEYSGSGSHTWSLWVNYWNNASTITDGTRLLECSSTPLSYSPFKGTDRFTISINNDNSYSAEHNTQYPHQDFGDDTQPTRTQPNAFVTGPSAWHLVTVVWDKENLHVIIYVNGALLAYRPFDGSTSVPHFTQRTFCQIGRSWDPRLPVINADIGYISYHTHALTPVQIKSMYEAPPLNVARQLQVQSSSTSLARLLSTAVSAFTWPTSAPATSFRSPYPLPTYSNGILSFYFNVSVSQLLSLRQPESNTQPGGRLIPASFSNHLSDGLTVTMWIQTAWPPVSELRIFDCYSSLNGQPNDSRFSLAIFFQKWRFSSFKDGVEVAWYGFPATAMIQTSEWYHVTVVIAKNNLLSLYINGALNSQPAFPTLVSGNVLNIPSSLLLPHYDTVGRDQCFLGGVTTEGGQTGFTGKIAGFHLFSKVLRQSEIVMLVSNPPAATVIPSAVAVPQQPLPAQASYQWTFSRASGKSTAAYTIIPAPSGQGVVAQLDGVTNNIDLYDQKDNIGGTPLSSTIPFGPALTFAMWIRVDAAGNDSTILDYGTASNNYDRVRLVLRYSSTTTARTLLLSYCDQAGVCSQLRASEGSIVSGRWYHISISFANDYSTVDTVRLYINGVLASAVNPGFAYRQVTRSIMSIGQTLPSGARTALSIASFSIFNGTALTGDQIHELSRTIPSTLLGSVSTSSYDSLLNEATAHYYVTNSTALDPTSTFLPGASPRSGIYSFDGSAEYLDLLVQSNTDGWILPTSWGSDQLVMGVDASNNGNNGFTVSMWITLTSYPAIGTFINLLSCSSSITGTNQYSLLFTSPGVTQSGRNAYEFQYLIEPLGIIIKAAIPNEDKEIPLNQPLHILIVLKQKTDTIFLLNGNQLVYNKQTMPSPSYIPYQARTFCYFGKPSMVPPTAGYAFFSGTLAQLIFWQRALKESEVMALATNAPSSVLQPNGMTAVTTPPNSFLGYNQLLTLTPSRSLTCGDRVPQSVAISFILPSTTSTSSNMLTLPCTNSPTIVPGFPTPSYTCQTPEQLIDGHVGISLALSTPSNTTHQLLLGSGLDSISVQTTPYKPKIFYIASVKIRAQNPSGPVVRQAVNEPLLPTRAPALPYTITLQEPWRRVMFEFVLPSDSGEILTYCFPNNTNCGTPMDMVGQSLNVLLPLGTTSLSVTSALFARTNIYTLSNPATITDISISSLTLPQPVPPSPILLGPTFDIFTREYSFVVEHTATSISLLVAVSVATTLVGDVNGFAFSRTASPPSTTLIFPVIPDTPNNTIHIAPPSYTQPYVLTVSTSKVTPVFVNTFGFTLNTKKVQGIPMTITPSLSYLQQKYYVTAPAPILPSEYITFSSILLVGDTVTYTWNDATPSTLPNTGKLNLTNVPVGYNTLLLTSQQEGTYNITIYNSPAPPTVCSNVVCQHGGDCLTQPSTTYNTPYTCYCTSTSWTGALCEVSTGTVDPPVATHPTAVLSASSSIITDCSSLTLDGSQSYNLGPIGIAPFYAWKVASIMLNGSEIANTADPLYNPVFAAQVFAEAPANTLRFTTIFPSNASTLFLVGTRMIDFGVYTFTLAVGNKYETSPVVSTVVTKASLGLSSSVPAWAPTLSLQASSTVRRSDTNTFVSILTPSDCTNVPVPDGLVYEYQWLVNMTGKLNETSAYPAISTLPIEALSMTSPSNGRFSVPAGFFRLGYTYSLSLYIAISTLPATEIVYERRRARMLLASSRFMAVAPFMISAQSTVTPTTSPYSPIALIAGSDRTKAVDTAFAIFADQSNDPDYPITAGQPVYTGLNFAWTCSVVMSAVAGEACNFTSSLTGTTDPVLSIPANVMTSTMTYEFRVRVTSIYDASRTISTSIRVNATAPVTILTPIISILNAPKAINIEDTLRLSVSVVPTTNTPVINMKYSWSLSAISSTQTTLPSLSDPANLGGFPNNPSLVLLPSLLQPGVYQFTVSVSDPNTLDVSQPSGYATATTSVIITVNARPQAGTCTLDLTEGISLQTKFTMTCQNWYEPLLANYQPFTYQIEYRDNTTSDSSYLQLTSPSQSSVAAFLLPQGSLVLRVIVTDQVDAIEYSQPISVTVLPPPTVGEFDLLQYIYNLTYITLPPLISSNDGLGAISLIHDIGNLINQAESMSQYADPVPQAKLLTYTDQVLSQFSIAWSVVLVQKGQNMIDTSSLNIAAQSLVPLSSLAVKFTGLMLPKMNVLVEKIVQSAISTTAKLNPTAAARDLSLVASNLLTVCSQLDYVSELVHEILRLRQRNAIAGEYISLDTLNYSGYVLRTLVAAGTELHLPSGQSVVLSAKGMAAYAAKLNQLNISSIDAGGAVGAAEMDTRIVTFSQQWSVCRKLSGSNNGGATVSALTSIELTFPNGDPIDIALLDTDIEFILPISRNTTESIIQQYKDSLTCQQLVQQDSSSAPFDHSLIPNSSFTCSFWNVTSKSYSSEGCYSRGVIWNQDQTASVLCSCSHLTEFAILLEEATAEENGGCDISSSYGNASYLIFLILYSLIGFISLIQLIRILGAKGFKKFWIISAEHILICLICIFRALNMAMYYTLYKSLSNSTQTILSGLPYLFYSWIFTFVVVTWASIWSSSARGEKNANPLKPYRIQFFCVNIAISAALFTIFGLMSATSDLSELQTLNRAGVGITCIVEFGFALFLVTYGLLLVRALTQHFVSEYAKKLGVIAISFCLAFCISAALLAYSAAEPTAYARHLIAYNSVYFSLDIVGLTLVMILFAASISKTVKNTNKSGSVGGSSDDSHTNNAHTKGSGVERSGLSSVNSTTHHRIKSRSQKSHGNIDASQVQLMHSPKPNRPVNRVPIGSPSHSQPPGASSPSLAPMSPTHGPSSPSHHPSNTHESNEERTTPPLPPLDQMHRASSDPYGSSATPHHGSMAIDDSFAGGSARPSEALPSSYAPHRSDTTASTQSYIDDHRALRVVPPSLPPLPPMSLATPPPDHPANYNASAEQVAVEMKEEEQDQQQ